MYYTASELATGDAKPSLSVTNLGIISINHY